MPGLTLLARWGEEESTALTPPKPASRSPARRKRHVENDDYNINSIGKVLTAPLQHLTHSSGKDKILLDEKVGQSGKGPAT